MYVPPYAVQENSEFLHAFVSKHSFGTLVSQDRGEAYANHFPFLLDARDGDKGVLWTHMARSNPQWKQLKETPECLAIFQGPQAYMSPSYYVEKLNVPTWNYTAVHAKGSAEIFEDAQTIEDILTRSVQHFEQLNPNPWKYELPREFRERLIQSIVGVRLEVREWQGKFKLSQNRSREDYESVLREFASRTDDNSRELLEYLKMTTPEKLK